MAAKKIITILALLLTLSLQLSAEDKPKKSKFRAVTHWVVTHKIAIAMSAGTAAATGLALHNASSPRQAPFTLPALRPKCNCGGQPTPPTP